MITTNSSPKDRFMADAKLAERHTSMVRHEVFQIASDHALLQYVDALMCAKHDPATLHHRLAGAREFLQILRDLGVSTPMPTLKDQINLNR